MTTPKANSPRKKPINPLIIEAVLKTVQESETPLEIHNIWKANSWIKGIPSIQSAAKLLNQQGLIKVTRCKGYSIYEKITDG